MAFVKITKNREGTRYVSIVEGYREGDKVKHRTLKSLGKLDLLSEGNPNYLEELKLAVKNGAYSKPSNELELTFDLSKDINNPLLNYGWKLIDQFYRQLDISGLIRQEMKNTKSMINIDEITRLFVAQRMINPGSKIKTIKTQGGLLGNFDFSKQDAYRSLDVLDDLSEKIQLRIHQSISERIGRTGALVFYDVTNYYFETDLDDEAIKLSDGTVEPAFRKRGSGKEKRPNPIVQMGLFMDTNGIPIAYKLFPGNCVDVKTYLPAIEQIKKQFKIERIVVVADKGMNSSYNISSTLSTGDGYLFSQKVRGKSGSPKDIQNFVLDHDGWEMNSTETFAKKSFIRTRIVNGQTITEKILATWNQKYDYREKIRRTKSVEYAEKLTASEKFRLTMNKGGKRYLDVKSVDLETGEIKKLETHISINKQQIKFDEQFDGINVLITSEVEMTDEAMLASYRALSIIENCFRTLKINFDARPIYVWTKSHINAHFLICFISLVIMRLIEYKTHRKISPERIIEGLKSAQCKELGKGYWEAFGNDDFLELNNLLGIEWKKKYVKLEELRKYGN